MARPGLSASQRRRLEQFRHEAKDARVFRNATIILLIADGHTEQATAQALGCCRATVDRVHRLYRSEGLDGLIPRSPLVGHRAGRRRRRRSFGEPWSTPRTSWATWP